MLTADHLEATYPDAPGAALGPVSFSLPTGTWHLATGGNGSGKSTLLLALSGAFTHHLGGALTGTVAANGHPLSSTPWAEWIRQVALLPQERRYQLSGARLTVQEEIAFPLENLGVPHYDMRQRVHALLEQLGIGALATRSPATLSGGEQQRVALAATLALKPSFLLLDDPCAQLDVQGTAVVVETLTALAAGGLGGLVATVQPEPFLALAARTLLLHEGELARHGRTRPIATDPSLPGLGVIPPAYLELAHVAGVPPPWPLTLEEAVAAFQRAPRAGPAPPEATSLERPPSLASPTPTPVRVDAVTFAYPGGPPVLHELSLDLAPGEITALIGPNGAGKSTLARTFNGLLRPQRGIITVGDHLVAAQPVHWLARRVGYLFQEPLDQLFNATVRAEVAFAPRQLGLQGKALDQRVAESLALAGLSHDAERHPYDLSPIEQRWVALASVLAQGASVLVLDEPARGMDRHHRQRLLALLRALRQAGYTVLIITHDMALVAELADRVLHLVGGQLQADAPPGPFFAASPSLRPPVSQLAARLGYGPQIVRVDEFLRRAGA